MATHSQASRTSPLPGRADFPVGTVNGGRRKSRERQFFDHAFKGHRSRWSSTRWRPNVRKSPLGKNGVRRQTLKKPPPLIGPSMPYSPRIELFGTFSDPPPAPSVGPTVWWALPRRKWWMGYRCFVLSVNKSTVDRLPECNFCIQTCCFLNLINTYYKFTLGFKVRRFNLNVK